jgi:hypothetical protein
MGHQVQGVHGLARLPAPLQGLANPAQGLRLYMKIQARLAGASEQLSDLRAEPIGH